MEPSTVVKALGIPDPRIPLPIVVEALRTLAQGTNEQAILARWALHNWHLYRKECRQWTSR